jgi:hypothetical protein
MKMTVIADKSGKVISTYMHPERPGRNDPTLHISGGPGHTTHELDVPAEYDRSGRAVSRDNCRPTRASAWLGF